MVNSELEAGAHVGAGASAEEELSEQLARAGAVAHHVGGGRVLFCGGRGAAGLAHRECMVFNADGQATWRGHSRMTRWVRVEAVRTAHLWGMVGV